MSLNSVISKLKNSKELDKEDIYQIFNSFERKETNHNDIKELVVLWNKKGETPMELFHLSSLINNRQNQHILTEDAIDMCGTGGDKLNTFNISTVSAIVASSCGLKIIKHSGRSTTSIQGSVDVLNSFGITTDFSPQLLENCFKYNNLIFVTSRILREVFGDVKIICKQLGIPGFVNLLGPLTNPYKTNYHLLGVSSPRWGKLIAETLKLLGTKKSFVVCGNVSEDRHMDELSFCGENYIWEISEKGIKEEKFSPGDIGMSQVDVAELMVKNSDENKILFEEILKGKINGKKLKYSRMDIVALNAGAALFISSKVNNMKDGYKHALLHIQSGKAWEHFQNFVSCIKSKEV